MTAKGRPSGTAMTIIVIAKIKALNISFKDCWHITHCAFSPKNVKNKWIIRTPKVKEALNIPIAPISYAKTSNFYCNGVESES